MAVEYTTTRQNKEKIEEWGMESRKFVERYHDHIKVAAQYLKIFENV